MKLTLAMGLQYDNGKEANMFAMSLGSDHSLPIIKADRAVVLESIQTHTIESESLPVQAFKRDDHAVFLTYNLRGFNDTLIFDHSLLDMFA